jgi:hypothetical protein
LTALTPEDITRVAIATQIGVVAGETERSYPVDETWITPESAGKARWT